MEVMADSAKKALFQDSLVEEINLCPSEMKALNKIAEETRRHGIFWEELKAELGL